MEQYIGNALGHLSIQPGDVIEVVGSTDCGLLEGYIRGVNRSGFFPAQCVQEVNIRQRNITNVSTSTLISYEPAGNEMEVVQQQSQQLQQQTQQPPPEQQRQEHIVTHQFNSATAPRIKKV